MRELEKIEMRKVYNNTLMELAESDSKVIALEADLMGAISTKTFAESYPKQLINVGIMESEMVGAAAGLALRGKIPFTHTFASFATRRCFDQLFLSLGYADLHAVIIGSDAGITAEHNGGTHMPFEDIGLMRLIPSSTVYEASDSTMLQKLIKQAKSDTNIQYIRMIRKNAIKLYSEADEFPKGGSKVLQEGKDGVFFASGIMVAECLDAADILKKQGIEITVVDVYSIQPLDRETIVKFAKNTKKVITAENHNIQGGLGSAVAETLMEEGVSAAFDRIGVHQSFGQVGETEYLKKVYKLRAEDIVAAYLNL